MYLLNVKNTTITNTPFWNFNAPNTWSKTVSAQHSFYIYFQARTANPIPNFLTQADTNVKQFLYDLKKCYGIKGYTPQMNKFIDDYNNIANTFYNSFLSNKQLVDTAWEPYHYLYTYGTNTVIFSFKFKISYNNMDIVEVIKNKYKPTKNSSYLSMPSLSFEMNITQNSATQG